MNATVQQARANLQALVERGHELDFGMNSSPSLPTARESAVLILFGAVDRVATRFDVPTVAPGIDVLLLRRTHFLSHHPGQMAFPGGGRESGDRSDAETALREAQEETGLVPHGVTILGNLPVAHLAHSANVVTPVLGWWDIPTPLTPDGFETDRVFRVPVAQLLDPNARYTSILNRDGLTYRGPMFRLGPQFDEEVVWGFTATILDTLFEELAWSVPWDSTRTHIL